MSKLKDYNKADDAELSKAKLAKTEDIEQLINLAKEKHAGLAEVSDVGLRKFFQTYINNTIIYKVAEKIEGFIVYQEWPDCLNLIVMVGDTNPFVNIWRILGSMDWLPPQKPFLFFDETRMEARKLSRK